MVIVVLGGVWVCVCVCGEGGGGGALWDSSVGEGGVQKGSGVWLLLFLEEVLNLPLSRGSGWRKCYTKIYDEKSFGCLAVKSY